MNSSLMNYALSDGGCKQSDGRCAQPDGDSAWPGRCCDGSIGSSAVWTGSSVLCDCIWPVYGECPAVFSEYGEGFFG